MSSAAASMAARLAAHPVMLAPMAGVTDAVYRAIALEHGCALGYTEMVSVAGLAYDSEKTWDLVMPGEEEPQVAVQLFGSRPEQFAPAAAAVVERLGERLAFIDINMACPVPKVFKKGEGCAMMADPDRACACLAGTVEGAAGAVPVTAKIRAGIREGEELAPSFAARLEQAGADAVAVHGRTAGQLYRGRADRGVVRRVVEAVSIPVIGSGDVFEARDCKAMIDQTGCAGVLVARGSYGNPWIFAHAEAILAGREEPPAPAVTQRLAALRRHIDLYHKQGRHMARLRPIVGWYIKGLPAASVWRNRSMSCSTVEDYRLLVDQMEDACREYGLA